MPDQSKGVKLAKHTSANFGSSNDGKLGKLTNAKNRLKENDSKVVLTKYFFTLKSF